MITTITCPACHAIIEQDITVNIGPVIKNNEERPEIKDIRIRRVETIEQKTARVIEAIEPHLKEGVTLHELQQVLKDEYHVCAAHIPVMIDRIKEAYQLYTPDGKTLRKIN